MNIAIEIIIIALLLLGGQLFLIWNLLRKVEKYEEDIILKNEFITKFRSMVSDATTKLNEIDNKGSFESDDEVGFFFKSIMNLSMTLNAYFKNYVQEDAAEKK
jgi:hypothetical protein